MEVGMEMETETETSYCTTPYAEVSHLPLADGSATFSHNGYTVIATANGPLEVGRRDEDPFAAALNVTVRPAAGVSGVREQLMETALRDTLAQLIPLRDYPRTLIQITLQVIEAPPDDYTLTVLMEQEQCLPMIPPLLHAAMLALLSGSIPLTATATAALLAVSHDGEIQPNPQPDEVACARSLHVIGFSSRRSRKSRRKCLLLSLGEGKFSLSEWSTVCQVARRVCYGQDRIGGDDGMNWGHGIGWEDGMGGEDDESGEDERCGDEEGQVEAEGGWGGPGAIQGQGGQGEEENTEAQQEGDREGERDDEDDKMQEEEEWEEGQENPDEEWEGCSREDEDEDKAKVKDDEYDEDDEDDEDEDEDEDERDERERGSLQAFMRATMEARIAQELEWRY